MVKIKIKDRFIGEDYSCFIIAELGSNHDGKLLQAKRLIDEAKKAGADCVKFQTFKADELVVKTHPSYCMIKRLELASEWHYILADYCKKKNIIFASTPFCLEAVDILESINIPFYKISSGDLTYYSLIKKVAKTQKPIFLSTGMSYLKEVERTVDMIKKEGNRNIALLNCISLYPTQIKDVNLNSLITLKNRFHLPVGLSDHTRSLSVAIGAVAMGASILERHFTLSCKLKGPDHPFAIEPKEFKEMVYHVRELEKAKGSFVKRPVGIEFKHRIYVRRRKISINGQIKYLRTYEGYSDS